ncbi:MAG: NUDIX domain-containing protein [Ginsengibacter sp.]
MLYRINNSTKEVFLVHPGGPFWRKKDAGAWTIPKGEFDECENALDAAVREFREETGISLSGEFAELKSIKLKSGKTVYAWAMEKDIDAENIASNNFDLEWPPHSGAIQSFPEVDKGAWFSIEEAKQKINVMQIPLLEQLEQKD